MNLPGQNFSTFKGYAFPLITFESVIYRTRGVVFRTIKFSETSVVSKIYTEKFGMQSYIVNGVRSAKSKTKAALLQVMSMLDMEVYHHENRNLHRIKEMQSFYSFRSLLFDPLKSSVGLFMMEVLNKCIREEESNEALFEFIIGKLKSLDGHSTVPSNFLLNFLLELSSLLGFYPHAEFNDATPYFDLREGKFSSEKTLHTDMIGPPLSENFSFLINDEKSFAELPESFNGSIRRSLLDLLLQYYRFHVPNFTMPHSLRVLDEVFHS